MRVSSGSAPATAPTRAAVLDVLGTPGRLAAAFQAIVDVRRGAVAGYEVLTRIDTPDRFPPDVWFAAATRAGLAGELEARAIDLALGSRSTLPAGTFLTVNVGPHSLVTAPVQRAFRAGGDLSGVLVEITEHARVDDHAALTALLEPLRAAGAGIAIDDAGSGYSGLQRLVSVRPQLVKVDRALVTRADRDEAKLAMIESLGNLAGRLDAWLLVEGVERLEELEAVARLGVPLAQGYLFGRPSPHWTTLPAPLAEHMRLLGARSTLVDHVASLVEAVPVLPPAEHDRARQVLAAEGDALAVVLVDERERPVGLVVPNRRVDDPPGSVRALPPPIRVLPSADVREVARRAMTRDSGERFDPLLCVEPEGRHVGLVRVERLVLRLAELKNDPALPKGRS